MDYCVYIASINSPKDCTQTKGTAHRQELLLLVANNTVLGHEIGRS
jgi:hypothetical protein